MKEKIDILNVLISVVRMALARRSKQKLATKTSSESKALFRQNIKRMLSERNSGKHGK